MPIAAIYARVSSDKQREESTIASQTAALIEFARSRGYQVPAEWVFEDEGYSGASLVRPALERLRDLAAEGQIEAVLVHAPDRLSRKYPPRQAPSRPPRTSQCSQWRALRISLRSQMRRRGCPIRNHRCRGRYRANGLPELCRYRHEYWGDYTPAQ